jgi:hypothetical protein
MAQAVSRLLATAAARVQARTGHVEFVVDKVALGQVFSSTSVSPANSHSIDCSHIHHLPSGAGTTGQLVADLSRGLILNPHQETNKMN